MGDLLGKELGQARDRRVGLERVLAEAVAHPRFQVGHQAHHRHRIQAVAQQGFVRVDFPRRRGRQGADAADDPLLDLLRRTAHRPLHRRSVARS